MFAISALGLVEAVAMKPDGGLNEVNWVSKWWWRDGGNSVPCTHALRLRLNQGNLSLRVDVRRGRSTPLRTAVYRRRDSHGRRHVDLGRGFDFRGRGKNVGLSSGSVSFSEEKDFFFFSNAA